MVANQYDASLITTGAATFSILLVALALFGALGGGRQSREANRSMSPGAA